MTLCCPTPPGPMGFFGGVQDALVKAIKDADHAAIKAAIAKGASVHQPDSVRLQLGARERLSPRVVRTRRSTREGESRLVRVRVRAAAPTHHTQPPPGARRDGRVRAPARRARPPPRGSPGAPHPRGASGRGARCSPSGASHPRAPPPSTPPERRSHAPPPGRRVRLRRALAPCAVVTRAASARPLRFPLSPSPRRIGHHQDSGR